MFGGVLGGLETDDGLGPRDCSCAVPDRSGHFFQDVQVLAGHHLCAHEVEDQPCPAARGGLLTDVGEGFFAEGQAKVAGEDGGGVAEPFAVQCPALGG